LPLDTEIFGQGIYTPQQAARLIGATPQEILRWTRGSGPSEPLWKAHYQDLDDTTEISFSDMIEVRVVKALRKAGVSLQAIRFAIEFARDKFGSDHPLVSLDFKTDGQEILIDALEHDGELVSLSRMHPGQKVFRDVVSQSLNDLEYEAGTAVLWRPSSAKHVVIDPQRSFGSPILDKAGISTRILFSDFQEYNDLSYVAKIYEVPRTLVANAVAFEKRLDTINQKSHGKNPI
jgi:uncharacterized protein (DUF433 family)